MSKQSIAALSFDLLVSAIGQVHIEMAAQAGRAVNVSLTLRNWLVGAYIREYEQQGADRAQYGDALLDRLSQALTATGTVNYHPRELLRCRAFYVANPPDSGDSVPRIWRVAKFNCTDLTRRGFHGGYGGVNSGVAAPRIIYSAFASGAIAVFQPFCRVDRDRRADKAAFL